jgi:hypothetical protein
MTYALHAVVVKKPVTKNKLNEIREHFINSREKSFMRETGQSFRIRNHSKQKFISKTFRTKKVNPNVSLIFGKLKPEWVRLEEHANRVRHLKGSGVLDYFKNKLNQVGATVSSGVRSVKDYFSPKLDDYNNKSKANIIKYGSSPVLKMHIYRTPLSSKVNTFLNLLSFGRLAGVKKKYGFDDFFHLALVCTIGNKHVMCQKNSVVDITENYKTTELTEVFDVNMKGKQFTLNDMLDKTRSRMGDKAYFEYDMLSHNCQNYVANLLISEGLYTPDVEAFVYQNIAEIIKEIPEFSKRLIRGATDLDATINKLTGGGVEEDFNDFIKKQRRVLGIGRKKGGAINHFSEGAVPYGRPQDSMKQRPNISDGEGVVPNKNDLLNRTALPINAPRNPALDIKPYDRIVGSGFHLYTLAQLKQIVKAFELHTKIKMTGLKKEQLLSEIEKHLIIKGDKIYIKSDNFDMPKFKINKKMEKHVGVKPELKPESKSRDIKEEIKALIKEIKDSGDKYKIDINKNEKDINKLNEMIKNYDIKMNKKNAPSKLSEKDEIVYMYNHFEAIKKIEEKKYDDEVVEYETELSEMLVTVLDIISSYYDDKYNEEVYNEEYDKKLLKRYHVDWDLLSKIIKSKKVKDKNVINYVDSKGTIIKNTSILDNAPEFQGDVDAVFKYMANAYKPEEKKEEKHNEDDIKLPKLSADMIEKIKSKIHPKHEMKKEVYAVLKQIEEGKQYIPLTGHNHMIMDIILRIINYEL